MVLMCFDFQQEVEMEDIAEEPILDIDSCDKKNQLAVVEYINDLYTYYKEAEVILNLHSTCFIWVSFNHETALVVLFMSEFFYFF